MYALIKNGIVTQTQPNAQTGFIKVPDGTAPNMLDNGDGTYSAPEIDLPSAKIKRKAKMASKFNTISIEPVPVNGITYNGGFDSALKLDGAKRLVELAGGTEVTFYDIDNKPNVLSIADATTVILTISAKVQTDFGHLQDLKVLIDSKLKVSTVEAIVW